MREVAESIELAGTRPDVDVSAGGVLRLLGYPRGWVLEGRALELADWAREWYAKNGRPWFYARQAESFATIDRATRFDIDGMTVHQQAADRARSSRRRRTA